MGNAFTNKNKQKIIYSNCRQIDVMTYCFPIISTQVISSTQYQSAHCTAAASSVYSSALDVKMEQKSRPRRGKKNSFDRQVQYNCLPPLRGLFLM
jgi:hypothetical protein